MDGSNFASFQKEYGKDDETDSYNDEADNGGHIGESPNLLSNLEVYEILRPRIQLRQRTSTATQTASGGTNDEESMASPAQAIPTASNGITKPSTAVERTMKKRQKLLRHRNWIEDEVVQYIQQTAAMEFHSNKHTLPLQSILRRRKRRSPQDKPELLTSTSALHNPSSKSESTKTTANTSLLTDESKMRLTMGFHLTEAEAIQILNHSPKEMVDLHLYIDQIHERFTISEQEELLRIIDSYRTIQSLPISTNGATIATRHSGSQQGSSKNATSTFDSLACNGVDNSSERYYNSSSNRTCILPPESEEYVHQDQHFSTGTTSSTVTSSNTVDAAVFANQGKPEIMDRGDRKPAAI